MPDNFELAHASDGTATGLAPRTDLDDDGLHNLRNFSAGRTHGHQTPISIHSTMAPSSPTNPTPPTQTPSRPSPSHGLERAISPCSGAFPILRSRVELFHTSIAMWDAWAAYDPTAIGYMQGVPLPSDVEAAREVAISYAAYRMLSRRCNALPYPARQRDRCADPPR